MDAWGLTNDSMKEDPWDYVHITTFNFLPFVLRRVGQAPRWLLDAVTGIWCALVGGLISTLALAGIQARHAGRDEFSRP
jgi:hypothetical protein